MKYSDIRIHLMFILQTKKKAEWLLCPAHTALLGVSQIVYGENNKVLYYNEQYIRSDIYKYVTGR